MRLIDADALNFVCVAPANDYGCGFLDGIDWAEEKVEKAPTIDAVEVVKRYEAIITENDKLKSEVSRLKSLIGEKGQELWSAENQRADKLQSELEHVKRERDAAVEDLNSHGFFCEICKHESNCNGVIEDCCFEWRGLQGGAEGD